MIRTAGSVGEGGGRILRTSVSLSLAAGAAAPASDGGIGCRRSGRHLGSTARPFPGADVSAFAGTNGTDSAPAIRALWVLPGRRWPVSRRDRGRGGRGARCAPIPGLSSSRRRASDRSVAVRSRAGRSGAVHGREDQPARANEHDGRFRPICVPRKPLGPRLLEFATGRVAPRQGFEPREN